MSFLTQYLILWEMKNIEIRHYDIEPKKLELRGGMDSGLGRSEQEEMHCRYIALSSWHKLGQGGHFPPWQIHSPSTDRHLGLVLDAVRGSVHQWKTSCFPQPSSTSWAN